MSAVEMRRRIAAELLESGLRRGGEALVHSSLSSLGHVPGGAETVVEGLLEGLGDEGTLLLPALSYEHVNARQPQFDVRHTPSNIGTIAEYFRTRPGSRRSLHPTHSVCGVGLRAGELLGEHHLDCTPCGPHSPFRRLREMGGQVVLLGCGMRPNTSIHGVEELVEPPYLFGETVHFELVNANGQVIPMDCRCHGFRGWAQRYERAGGLLEGDGLKVGTVLQATVHILEAEAMWARGEEALKGDPLFFVERVET